MDIWRVELAKWRYLPRSETIIQGGLPAVFLEGTSLLMDDPLFDMKGDSYRKARANLRE